MVAVGGCSSPGAPSGGGAREALAFRGDSARVIRIAEVAAEEGVPRDVLLTLAWSESRLVSMQQEASDEHEHAVAPCGHFGFDAGEVREHAAALVGADEEMLCTDEALEARAAARVLRELADREALTFASGDAEWFALLDAWHPELQARNFGYAEYVMQMRRQGFHAADEHGESIYMPPLPTLSRASNGVAGAHAASTPDSSLATWRGPACEYTPASRGVGDVDYIVIHTCEGGFAGCVSTVSACSSRPVSAHYVTSYTGMTAQLVEENDIAWHVGCLNSSSIGIEHEGFASAATHPDAQYCQTARLVRSICDRWEIPCDRAHIIGHVEANSMFCHGSHTDPGAGWDWDTFMGYVNRGECDACTPRTEVCDGHDNDCDGMVDEGVSNACGGCGRLPREVCDGHDNDCDGSVDEGVLNDCGGCGPVPREVCDGEDNDCDGVVDDFACDGERDGGEPQQDASTPKSDGGAGHEDGGSSMTPMQPGCSVTTSSPSHAQAGWAFLTVLLAAALVRATRRRA